VNDGSSQLLNLRSALGVGVVALPLIFNFTILLARHRLLASISIDTPSRSRLELRRRSVQLLRIRIGLSRRRTAARFGAILPRIVESELLRGQPILLAALQRSKQRHGSKLEILARILVGELLDDFDHVLSLK
jgi:hypothetical protein